MTRQSGWLMARRSSRLASPYCVYALSSASPSPQAWPLFFFFFSSLLLCPLGLLPPLFSYSAMLFSPHCYHVISFSIFFSLISLLYDILLSSFHYFVVSYFIILLHLLFVHVVIPYIFPSIFKEHQCRTSGQVHRRRQKKKGRWRKIKYEEEEEKRGSGQRRKERKWTEEEEEEVDRGGSRGGMRNRRGSRRKRR